MKNMLDSEGLPSTRVVVRVQAAVLNLWVYDEEALYWTRVESNNRRKRTIVEQQMRLDVEIAAYQRHHSMLWKEYNISINNTICRC